MKVSSQQFAALVNCNDATIYKLIADGVLLVTERKQRMLLDTDTQKKRYYYYRNLVGDLSNIKVDNEMVQTINQMEKENAPYSKPNAQSNEIWNDRSPDKKSVARRVGAERNEPKKEEVEPVLGDIDYKVSKLEDRIQAMAIAKLRKEKAQAQKAELEADEKSGKLILVEEIRTAWRDIGIKVQKSILAIPDRLAPVLASEMDSHKVHRMMTDEFKYALRNLSMELLDKEEE